MWADTQLDGCPAEYRWRLCESSVIPFLVPGHKVWLMAAAWVPCSRAANIGECKTWIKVNFRAGKIPLEDKSPWKCIYSVPVQETAKHCTKFGWPPVSDVTAVTKARRETCWNLLGCLKLLKWSQLLVGRKFAILWEHVEGVLLFNKFFFRLSIRALVAKIQSTKLCNGAQMMNFLPFFASCISASHVQHISDLHSKFALRPHYVWTVEVW